MNSDLQDAIAGESITVKLDGKDYVLAYPMQAVILYKRETARLDRERAAGRPRLMRQEKRDLRERRQKLLAEMAELLARRGDADFASWRERPEFLDAEALAEEATSLKIQLDEDAGQGDSLFDIYNWRKINPETDPERLFLALWVALHHFSAASSQSPEKTQTYSPQFSKEQLGPLIHPGNVADLTLGISKALAAHLNLPEDEEQDALPNPQPPATPAEKAEAIPQEEELQAVLGHPEMELDPNR